MCALVYCDDLRLNASFQGLVQNEMFQSLVEEVALKRILAGLAQIAKAETHPQVFEMVAKVLGSLRGRMPEAVEAAVQQASIAGRSYRELRRVYGLAGYLPVEGGLEVAESVLRELFPACINLSEVRVPESLEILQGGVPSSRAPLHPQVR